jgi:non-heme chloroperoxidase
MTVAYAADVTAVVDHLKRKNTNHVGHSTGHGRGAHYVAAYEGSGRVAKTVLLGAVPPVILKSEKNAGGLPIEAFGGLRNALAANRSWFYRDVPSGPFYGFNRAGAKVSQSLIDNWWRQGVMGGARTHYECIKVSSETDLSMTPRHRRVGA